MPAAQNLLRLQVKLRPTAQRDEPRLPTPFCWDYATDWPRVFGLRPRQFELPVHNFMPFLRDALVAAFHVYHEVLGLLVEKRRLQWVL